ncbi:MAG: site-specific DNA-methyltransferase [Candidatus Brocadiales bacterium]|nr:site-specific DNA-methyltransferase [Candidatus Brocadiales bacterium]
MKRNYSADVPTRRQKKSPVNQSDSSRWVKTIIEAPAKPNMTKSERTSHPTQKSIKLMSQLIVTYSDENATVCDPFAGSGTTLLAAHKLGREVFGFEIMEEFYLEATERIRRYLSQGDLFRPEDYSNPEELI